MRRRSVPGLVCAGLLLLATGGPAALAENDDRYPGIQRFGQPQGYGSAYGARQRSSTQYDRYQPQAQPSSRAVLLRSALRHAAAIRPAPGHPAGLPVAADLPAAAGRVSVLLRPARAAVLRALLRAAPGAAELRPAAAKGAALRPGGAEAREADKPEVAEVEPSSYVVVFGDALAELVAQGLDTAFEDADDIGVEKKVRADSGLVRPDVYDWPKAIQEYLNGGQKVTYAVVMLGSNDRQAMREGENAIDPLSERWKEIYRQRIDDVVKVFTEKKIPLIWVGTPPVKNERASADFLAINDLYRERVQKAGAIYVDIWPGFVDDQNRYAATGPDVDGQVVRLRSADGVYFTRAGARKAAHFADIELKRLIEQRGGTAVAAPSTDGTPAAKELDVERVISASLPALPEPQGLPSLPVSPGRRAGAAADEARHLAGRCARVGPAAARRRRLSRRSRASRGISRAAEARTSRRVQVAAVVERQRSVKPATRSRP